MSSTTPNLGLIKPAETEIINVADINTNSDKIDVSYKNMFDQAKELAKQIKTAQETLASMNQLITQNKNAITQLNSDLGKHLNIIGLIKGSITSFADTCPFGLTVVSTGNGTDTIPGMSSNYSIGFVLNRGSDSGVIVLFSYSRKEIYIINKNGVWDSTATVIK